MRDPREPLAFALLILPCVVVVRFLAVAAHEVLGHGLFSMALGGSFYAVYLSPGQGSAYVYLAAPAYGAVDWASVAVNLAGIAVELLLGLAVLLLYPRVRGFVPRLFVLLLLSVLLVHTFLYMAVGALPLPGLRGDTANAVVLLKAPPPASGFPAAPAPLARPPPWPRGSSPPGPSGPSPPCTPSRGTSSPSSATPSRGAPSSSTCCCSGSSRSSWPSPSPRASAPA